MEILLEDNSSKGGLKATQPPPSPVFSAHTKPALLLKQQSVTSVSQAHVPNANHRITLHGVLQVPRKPLPAVPKTPPAVARDFYSSSHLSTPSYSRVPPPPSYEAPPPPSSSAQEMITYLQTKLRESIPQALSQLDIITPDSSGASFMMKQQIETRLMSLMSKVEHSSTVEQLQALHDKVKQVQQVDGLYVSHAHRPAVMSMIH